MMAHPRYHVGACFDQAFPRKPSGDQHLRQHWFSGNPGLAMLSGAAVLQMVSGDRSDRVQRQRASIDGSAACKDSGKTGARGICILAESPYNFKQTRIFKPALVMESPV
jgi:hypothetical protein